MLDLEGIRRRLKTSNLAALSRETGLHRNTIETVLEADSNPTYKTLKALSDYFEELESK